MSDEEVIEVTTRPLTKQEVERRVETFRNALQMSRKQFGKLVTVKFSGNAVCIGTSKHDMWIKRDAWESLGEIQL